MSCHPDLIAGRNPSFNPPKGSSAAIPQFRRRAQFKNLPTRPRSSSINAATASRSWAFGGSKGDCRVSDRPPIASAIWWESHQ